MSVQQQLISNRPLDLEVPRIFQRKDDDPWWRPNCKLIAFIIKFSLLLFHINYACSCWFMAFQLWWLDFLTKQLFHRFQCSRLCFTSSGNLATSCTRVSNRISFVIGIIAPQHGWLAQLRAKSSSDHTGATTSSRSYSTNRTVFICSATCGRSKYPLRFSFRWRQWWFNS